MSSTIFVAGAGWCGFTQKAITAIDGHASKDRFEVLNCSPTKDDPDSYKSQDDSAKPACQELQKQRLGFPTFMKCDGDSCTVVKVGFTNDLKRDVLDVADNKVQ